MASQDKFTCFIMGEGSLLIKCGERILSEGHRIIGVVSPGSLVHRWADGHKIPHIDPKDDYISFLRQQPFDYLFSIINYTMIPPEVIDIPQKMPINFHDALLPAYAGIHASSWALLNREAQHGITWHVVVPTADEGDLLKQRAVDIEKDETALSLNLKCHEASYQTFCELVSELASGTETRTEQDLTGRSYYPKYKRLPVGGTISWETGAEDLDAMVRALEFGPSENPLGTAKLFVNGSFFIVSGLKALDTPSTQPPGTVVAATSDSLQIATKTNDIAVRHMRTIDGKTIALSDFIPNNRINEGVQLQNVEPATAKRITKLNNRTCKHEAFWVQRLPYLEVVSLPFADRVEFDASRVEYHSITTDIPETLYPLLTDTSLCDFLASAFLAFLGRLNMSQEFDIGVRFEKLRKSVEGLTGYFSPFVPMHVALDESAPLKDVMAGLENEFAVINRRRTYPHDMLMRYPALRGSNETGEAIAYPVIIDYVANLKEYQPEAGLEFVFAIQDDGKSCLWLFDKHTFEEQDVEKAGLQFLEFLSGFIANPDTPFTKLPLLTPSEKSLLLDEWNRTESSFDVQVLPYQLFEHQVEANPEKTALIFEDQELTYAELNRKANQLANLLRDLGIGKDKLVGISLERSMDIVVCQLGIQKAGGAYVPLDPKYPADRIDHILEEAKVSVVCTQKKLEERYTGYDTQIVCMDADAEKMAACSDENPKDPATADYLSHVIYTSGSTGKPKGVAIEHRSVGALTHWTREIYSDEELSGVLASTSLNFDISVFETISTLALGGTTIIVENAMYLPSAPARQRVKLINTVPSAIKELLKMNGIPENVITVNLAGEPLKNAVVQQLYSIDHVERVYNLYGPSEDTTYSTWALMERGEDYVVMIGRPLSNTVAYVLDAHLQPVPVGVPGELYLGGIGLAREYLNRPDLTEERFIPDPFSDNAEDRIYMTGDLVRYWTNGSLECMGRIDHQVKIRGFRIELGEIEACLQKYKPIREAIVVDKEDPNGEKILVGYVTLKPDEEATGQEIRDYLKEHLPDYFVPSFVMVLDEMPLNPNGKIDRKKLPEPKLDLSTSSIRVVKPGNEMERIIAGVWQEVLHLDNVSTNASFFDLGGHSLLLEQVRFKLRDLLKRDILTTDLFQYPTISSLARFLDPEQEETAKQDQDRYRGKRSGNRDIAVIGMAGRFPGAVNVDAFWENLRDGVESFSRFTDQELESSGISHGDYSDPDYVPVRGILEDVGLFDASFFGFNPREAEILDPQQRIFLEESWNAMENAGYNPDTYSGRVGVFTGANLSTYYRENLLPNRKLIDTVGVFQAMIANDKDFLSSRVSYKLNLRGPGLTILTACSTSLVTVHVACKSLIDRESDIALAGGVSVQVPQKSGYMYQEGGIHSPDGHVRAFDARGQGMVISSGAGVVVLKRLDEAVDDGDRILAVVKATAINNDGSNKVGYTAPSVEGQAEVIADAHAIADIDPDSITYIETHGTATGMGDPIEIAALTKAFRLGSKRNGYCAIGGVKTNIGHLDAAAGIAGFIKTVLSLKNKQIPPSLNFETPNPNIDFENSPFYVNHQLQDWKQGSSPRRAGVSAFGIGGTNAHVILEEAPEATESGQTQPWHLLVLSAKTPSALEKVCENVLEDLKRNPDRKIDDVAYTLQVGRKPFGNRRYLVCQGTEDAIDLLETQNSKMVFTNIHDPNNRPVVFMFSGQGSQYVGMAHDLFLCEPTFRSEVDLCCEFLKAHLDLDLRDLLYPDGGRELAEEEKKEAANRLNQTAMAQPALFVIEYALARLWISWGIQPQSMVGHSIGEYVAACLAGVLSVEDALALVAARGRLMQSLPPGDMMAVPAAEEKILPYLGEDVSMATVNAPTRCVVAGTKEAIDAFEKTLQEEGFRCSRLHTSHAFHSSMMDPILDEFTDIVSKVELKPPTMPYLSNVTGTWITPEQATDPSYYAKHLRGTVRFAANIGELLEGPDQIFLEVGPGKTLMTFARQQIPKNSKQVALSSVRHPKDQIPDVSFLLNTLGQLWLAGCEVSWTHFHAHETRHRVPLPTYPFERRRFWIEPVKTTESPAVHQGPPRRRSDVTEWFYTPIWKQALPLTSVITGSKSAWLVFKDECGLGDLLCSRLEDQGHGVVSVGLGTSYQKISDHHYSIHPGRREDYQSLLNDLSGSQKLPNMIAHLWGVTSQRHFRSSLEFSELCNERGFYSMLFLAQALEDQELMDQLQIAVVTNNMQRVADEDFSCPEKAPVLGPCKVIPREYPQITCRSIDISLPKHLSEESFLLDAIIAEMETRSEDLLVAYRGRRRWTQQFEAIHLEKSENTPLQLKQNGVYLITGGMGGIGLVVAEMLAREVNPKLILVGRSAFPEKETWQDYLATHDESDRVAQKIRQLKHLESLGAEVMHGRGDVTSLEDMKAVSIEAYRRFGGIDGVIHAAGLFPSGMITDETPEMAARVMDPKVKGTLVLDSVFRQDELDFMVLFSSTSVVLGNMGFLDYCAANAFLDAFAHHRQGKTRTYIVAASWDGWKDVGMAADKYAGKEAKQPEGYMAPNEGVEALRRILSTDMYSQVLVSPLEFHVMLNEIQSFLSANLLGEKEETVDTSPTTEPAQDRPDLDTSFIAPRNETEKIIADLWQESLGVDQIGMDDDFIDLGGDSLLATMVASRLRKLFKVKVSPRLISEEPTVAGLAQAIDGLRREKQGLPPLPATEAKPIPKPASEPPAPKEPEIVIVPPESDLERSLLELWQEILGVQKLGITNEFKSLGGTPESGRTLIARISQEHQVDLPDNTLDEAPTIKELAEHIEAIHWAVQSVDTPETDEEDDEEFDL